MRSKTQHLMNLFMYRKTSNCVTFRKASILRTAFIYVLLLVFLAVPQISLSDEYFHIEKPYLRDWNSQPIWPALDQKIFFYSTYSTYNFFDIPSCSET